MASTDPTYYIRKSTTSRYQPYFWNVIASNGKELARSSETYVKKSDAIASANMVRLTYDNPFKDVTGE